MLSQLPGQLTTQLSNYAKYNDDKKSLKLNINSDTDGDYFTLSDINSKPIAKFGKNSVIDNINSKQIVIDGKNQMGIILKNTAGGQQNIFSIQNGNDGSDFIRIGQVTLKTDGSMDTQTPFIRMDKNTTTGDLTTMMRSNVLFSKDINIGADNYYYNISRDDKMCLNLKYKVKDKNDVIIGKWCPDNNVVIPT